jgi:hypothetical protein
MVRPIRTSPSFDFKPPPIDVLPPSVPSSPESGAGFQTPTPHITLSPGLNRPPNQRDLRIKRTFDGLSPTVARDKVLSRITNPIAKENLTLTQNQVDNRVRDMQAALNNVFTPGTPPRQFFESLQPTALVVHSTLSDSSPVYYEVLRKSESEPRFYARDWSGRLAEVARPKGPTIMSASIRLEPQGIAMVYPKWSMPALAGPLSTITEGR